MASLWADGLWAAGLWADGLWYEDDGSGGSGDPEPAQLAVHALSSVSGLQRWVDYIPVQYVTFIEAKKNTYDDDGFQWVLNVSDVSGLVPWVDYTPVYIVSDPASGKARFDDDGWIPVATS